MSTQAPVADQLQRKSSFLQIIVSVVSLLGVAIMCLMYIAGHESRIAVTESKLTAQGESTSEIKESLRRLDDKINKLDEYLRDQSRAGKGR